MCPNGHTPCARADCRSSPLTWVIIGPIYGPGPREARRDHHLAQRFQLLEKAPARTEPKGSYPHHFTAVVEPRGSMTCRRDWQNETAAFCPSFRQSGGNRRGRCPGGQVVIVLSVVIAGSEGSAGHRAITHSGFKRPGFERGAACDLQRFRVKARRGGGISAV